MNANEVAAMGGNEPHGAMRGLLLFRSAGRLLALPDACVLTVELAGTTSPLPFTPPWVEGLANVGGRILPQADLAALLGQSATAGRGDLLVIRTPRAQCALHVEQVLARIDVPAEAVQAFMADDEARASVYIAGEFHHDGQVVLLLDSERLGELFSAQAMPEGRPGLLGRLESKAVQRDDDSLACLCFAAAGEHYAMALTDVGEIIAGGDITAVPGTPASVAGIATLRGEPLLMVSLARLLGLTASLPVAGAESMALVLDHEALRIGLMVDAVDGMRRFPDHAVRRLQDAAGDMAGVLHDDSGRVLGLLSRERLLRAERAAQLAPYMPARRSQRVERVRVTHPHLQVQLGGEAFGIPLPLVQRIVDWHPAEPVQDDSGRIAGVVNIEGEVLPVLAPERLHQSAVNRQPTAWVVLGAGQARWAMAVDAAQAIVPVAEDDMEKVGNGSGLIEAVAKVDERLLSIVSLNRLLDAAA